MILTRLPLLQRSRAFVSAEIPPPLPVSMCSNGASTEPRFCERGNPRTLMRSSPTATLQRSRAFVSAEISCFTSTPNLNRVLQRSRAFVSAEMDAGHAPSPSSSGLQRSRAFVSAEINWHRPR